MILQPCPYCATEHPRLTMRELGAFFQEEYQVSCPDCGARGPCMENCTLAGEMWNQIASIVNSTTFTRRSAR